jgi:hypothetical protein
VEPEEPPEIRPTGVAETAFEGEETLPAAS